MDAPEIAALAVLLSLLALLAAIDVRRRILPNALIYPGIVAALAAAPILPAGGYIDAVAGGVLAFGIFAVAFFARPQAMGAGDVKLAALIGLTLGFPIVLLGLLVASLLAAVVSAAMLTAGRWTRSMKIAYGPYLCAGCGGVALWVAL